MPRSSEIALAVSCKRKFRSAKNRALSRARNTVRRNAGCRSDLPRRPRPIGGEWVLFGTAKDEEVGAQIAAALGGACLNLIGQTTLEQLIEELRKCRLLLTNDTGTMHLATLLGVPVVAVFGSTEPSLTGPLGKGNRVVRHHVECSPCFLRECPLDFRCMKAVSAEEVAAIIRDS